MCDSTTEDEPAPIGTRTRVPSKRGDGEPKRDDTEPIATTTRAP